VTRAPSTGQSGQSTQGRYGLLLPPVAASVAGLVGEAAAAVLTAVEALEAAGDDPVVAIVSSAGMPVAIDLGAIFEQLRELADHLEGSA
jgi:hypothetical protein